MPDNFTAEPAADGTYSVLVRVDPATALQLAASWEHSNQTNPVNGILRPLFYWDVAALRRAAADAIAIAEAAGQYSPATRAHLRLVDTAEVKTS